MSRKNICSALLLIALFLSGCSSAVKYSEDENIKKDITEAVNNYNSDNWEIRLESVKSISKYSNTIYAKNSLLLVLKAIEDSHSEVRIEALKILKTIKAPAAEEKIRNIALSDENSNVKYFAFSAIEGYGNIKNEDLFIKGLSDDDWLVREAALKGLMNIDDPEIQTKHIAVIIKAINDENISIRLTAIENITIKDPLIYDELSKIILNKESGLTILKAALQKIKGYKIDTKTKARMIELLTHRDKKIRLFSLQALKMEELILNP